MVKIIILILLTINIFAFKMEGDIITVNSTNSGNSTHINFRETFDTTPLVFVLMDKKGAHSASFRLMNITTSGFDIYTVEPESWDGKHTKMTNIPYIAIEEGNHLLPNGDKILAGKVSSSRFQSRLISGSSWDTVSLSGFNTTPIVLGQIQTRRNERTDQSVPHAVSQPWMTTVIDNVSSSSFRISMERSETTTGTLTQNEDIAYLVMNSNLSGDDFQDNSNNTIEYETILSPTLIAGWGTEYQVNFSKNYRDPVVVATKNTRFGIDGGWLRRTRINDQYIRLSVDEDTAFDSERDHANERAGILIFGRPFDVDFTSVVSFLKWSEVISDTTNGTNNPKRIPGAVIRYCFEATNTGFSSVQNVNMNDVISSQLTYINSGYIKQNKNTSCNCKSITDTSGSISGNTVSINFGDLGGLFQSSTSRGCSYIETSIN